MFDATLYAICKKFTKDWVASHATLKKTIVEQLPPVAEADESTIYFVPVNPSDATKGYDEYLIINGQWELLTSATVEVELDDIGFMVDENDDEMLIIDCKQHFAKVTTPEEFVRYIEQTFNITIGSDYVDNIKSWYSWYENLLDDEKNNVYLVLVTTKTRYNFYSYTAYYIYTQGKPSIDLIDNEYYLRCILNGEQISFSETYIWYANFNASGEKTSEQSYAAIDPPKTESTWQLGIVPRNYIFVGDQINDFSNLIIKEN